VPLDSHFDVEHVDGEDESQTYGNDHCRTDITPIGYQDSGGRNFGRDRHSVTVAIRDGQSET
jgi:hypothetical protein